MKRGTITIPAPVASVGDVVEVLNYRMRPAQWESGEVVRQHYTPAAWHRGDDGSTYEVGIERPIDNTRRTRFGNPAGGGYTVSVDDDSISFLARAERAVRP